MNLPRSILAVLGGFLLFRVITELLEVTLVAAVAGGPVADEASYFAVRNRPGLLAARVGYTAVVALLAGYMAAKIAPLKPLHHTGVAAALVTALLLVEFAVSPSPPPMAIRLVLVALTGPAMLTGGWIRASAAALQTPSPPSDHDQGARS